VQYRFKLYDDFAESLFSLTTFINPKTNKADVFSVTFRRNDTSRHYEGQHKDTYDEMIAKANELLGGFDIEKYCIEKTEERLRKCESSSGENVSKKPQDAIPAPLMPSKAKVKVSVAKKRKTPQEVRKSAEPSNEVKTNFELTEENKASMEEMLSIKSGELLENVLNK
jgi:hypothetical protein